MAQRCPICKARLWTHPLFTPAQLSCPRCGASFRPTVAWGYFRFLLLVVVALAVTVISFLSETSLSILLFLLLLVLLFWFLPRFIDLQRISGELGIPEGPVDTEQMKLRLEDERWNDKRETLEEQSKFRQLIYLLVAVVLVLFLMLVVSLRG